MTKPIGEQIRRLRTEKRFHLAELDRINKALDELTKKCQHENTTKSPWYKVLDSGSSDVMERLVTCLDCGHSQHEQRYGYEI
jgi:hypothetical protein